MKLWKKTYKCDIANGKNENATLQGEIMYRLFGDDMHKDFVQMLSDVRKYVKFQNSS